MSGRDLLGKSSSPLQKAISLVLLKLGPGCRLVPCRSSRHSQCAPLLVLLLRDRLRLLCAQEVRVLRVGDGRGRYDFDIGPLCDELAGKLASNVWFRKA
jgi:hypothetical protein